MAAPEESLRKRKAGKAGGGPGSPPGPGLDPTGCSAGLRAGTFWLTRIVLLRALAFIYFVAFLVAFHQNKQLIGDWGLLPCRAYLKSVQQYFRGRVGWDAVSYAPTVLWLLDWSHMDSNLDALALLGLGVSSFVLVTGCANMVLMATLWVLYMSLVNVGQIWYSFGWESQLLETGFLGIFLCPLWTLSRLPRGTPPSRIVLWGFRWLIFRIMLGAGLIKIRGDRCWRDLTCMDFHYEVILIISGNLSFLNWLTMVPSVACFDDATLGFLFPSGPGGLKYRVLKMQEEAARGALAPLRYASPRSARRSSYRARLPPTPARPMPCGRTMSSSASRGTQGGGHASSPPTTTAWTGSCGSQPSRPTSTTSGSSTWQASSWPTMPQLCPYWPSTLSRAGRPPGGCGESTTGTSSAALGAHTPPQASGGSGRGSAPTSPPSASGTWRTTSAPGSGRTRPWMWTRAAQAPTNKAGPGRVSGVSWAGQRHPLSWKRPGGRWVPGSNSPGLSRQPRAPGAAKAPRAWHGYEEAASPCRCPHVRRAPPSSLPAAASGPSCRPEAQCPDAGTEALCSCLGGAPPLLCGPAPPASHPGVQPGLGCPQWPFRGPAGTSEANYPRLAASAL
ncbi:lipase maturation factor 1 isoform X4 [Canis lupus dingo]|uniref:lipase maturation factor 1 isoform X4 n=1 Tax=Canis lupus dingo TaxID=286419 RepID=UPI0020C47D0C|nr:lipase maturation factor 1 isoform X4 [Canis lupus dingo]